MNKRDLLSMLQLLLTPVLVIALGLLLLFNPDSASVLIAKVLGWLVLLVGGGFAIAALVDSDGRTGKVITAGVLFAAGMFLSRNPLVLAAWVGRLVGIFLLVDGIQDILHSRKMGIRYRMPIIVAAIGAVLILMPMTTSRLVFSACGLLVLVIGVVMLLDRLRTRRLPEGDNDPNIIDAL